VLHVDEELRGGRIAHAGARHGDGVVVVLEAVHRLVLDRRAHGLLLHRLVEAAALDHEAVDHAVEDGAVVMPRLHVLPEVGGAHGGLRLVDLEDDRAHGGGELDLHQMHSAFSITTGVVGTFWWPLGWLPVGTPLILSTTSLPSTTWPNTA